MDRFCTTARIFRPNEVLKNQRYTSARQATVTPRMNSSIARNDERPDIEAAAQLRWQIQRLLIGRECEFDALLHDHADAPGTQQRVQRPAVHEANQTDFQQIADECDDEERYGIARYMLSRNSTW